MGIGDELQMLRAAMGEPAKLALLAVDLAYPSMPERQRIYLKETLQVMAIPHWCDRDLLEALCQVSRSEAARRFDDLQKLNVVEFFPSRGPNTVNIHEATRLALREEMWRQEKEYFCELSKRASAFFSRRYTPANRIEWLYHLLIANPELGLAEYEAIHQQWNHQTHFENRWALALVIEELGKSGMLPTERLQESGLPSRHAYSFEFLHFRLDIANRLLWHNGQKVSLRPKSFALLWYLVAHHSKLVTRDDLLKAVWPDQRVGDSVLKVAISELRRVLSDNPDSPTYLTGTIEHGYRFNAEVTTNQPEEKANVADRAESSRSNSLRRCKQSSPAIKEAGLKFSERETEIIYLLRSGKTNAEIATILGISPHALKNQLHQIFRRLDVCNRMQAVAKMEVRTPWSTRSPLALKR
jgi:DNA-binding winged helix-turn-helix (wHTH) protein